MSNYQFVYRSSRDNSLQHVDVEGEQAFIDSSDILDRNNASYDCYVVHPNGNKVEISETSPRTQKPSWFNWS
jgi:hypothetical protein